MYKFKLILIFSLKCMWQDLYLNCSYFVVFVFECDVLKILHNSNFSNDSKLVEFHCIFYIYLIFFKKGGIHV